MVRVAVIQHERQLPALQQYGLGLIAEQWRDRGIEVVEIFGPQERIDADVAILHVDLTLVPSRYTAALSSVPSTVNARLTDISKRSFSRLLLRRGERWDGPVLVKTNLNCGGAPEKLLLGHTGPRDPWRFIPRRLSIRLRKRFEPMIDPYHLFPSVSEVPHGFWSDPDLVVERFVAERDGEDFVLRRCHFLGSRAVNVVYRSAVAIARGNALTEPRRCDPPDELWRIRQELGVDYGRLDYAMVEGAVVLYDINRTPSVSRRTPRLEAIASELAPGIDDYLTRGG